MEGISTSTDSGSTTTGPATFAEAFAADASSASTPSDSTPATSASADTTDPLATSAVPDGSTPATGEPPRERWDTILQNARQKAAEEAIAPLAWAKQVNQAELQSVMELARKASTDPIAYLQDFVKELQTHPTYGAQLKSLAAKALAQRSSQPAAPDLNPIAIQLENGQNLSMYSAEQMQALVAQEVAKVKQEFQPVFQTHEQLQAERAQAQHQAQVDHFVTSTYTDVQTWPGMADKANQVAVANALAAANVSSDDPREVSLALNAAYRQVVLPKLSQTAQTALLDNLKTKAAAATSVNPGSAASSSPRAVTSFNDPSLKWK